MSLSASLGSLGGFSSEKNLKLFFLSKFDEKPGASDHSHGSEDFFNKYRLNQKIRNFLSMKATIALEVDGKGQTGPG